MYGCILALPLCSPVLPAKKKKKHSFSSVFAKRTSKHIEFCQIFSKRMQEAQASKKAGRGNRAWDPCFATPAPRRLRLVERHQIAARYVGDPPPKKTYVIRRAGGGSGGGYPLSSSKYPTRRAMSADLKWVCLKELNGICPCVCILSSPPPPPPRGREDCVQCAAARLQEQNGSLLHMDSFGAIPRVERNVLACPTLKEPASL